MVRSFVGETRANILINLTNDAWYGRSVGPWQHLRLAQSRAIETRRSLLRVTNTGVTSLVNAKGELVKTLPMFTAAVMQTEVDVLNETTYYVRFGDWFAWAMTIATLVLILLQVKRSWLMNERVSKLSVPRLTMEEIFTTKARRTRRFRKYFSEPRALRMTIHDNSRSLANFSMRQSQEGGFKTRPYNSR